MLGWNLSGKEQIDNYVEAILERAKDDLKDRVLLPLPLKSVAISKFCTQEPLSITAVSMQGWRATMEDDFSVQLSLPKHKDILYAAVFDGHAGPAASWWFSQKLHAYFDRLDELTPASITEACFHADSDFSLLNAANDDGTTAVFIFLQPLMDSECAEKHYRLTVGNIGDSRCLLISHHGNVVQLTQDHTPLVEEEKQRILRAGGRVSADGRIDGCLAVSRCFGDFYFKSNANVPAEEQKVVPLPDVVTTDIVGHDVSILLCCDGLFECMTTQQVGNFISERVRRNCGSKEILCELLEESISRGSQDNMTAVLIQFSGEHQNEPNASGGELRPSTVMTERELLFGKLNGGALDSLSDHEKCEYLLAYTIFARNHASILSAADALKQFCRAYNVDYDKMIVSLSREFGAS